MDIRFHGLNGALLRRFAAKAGSRERERVILERLIALYVDDVIDLSSADPIAAAFAARGGRAAAEGMTTEARQARAQKAARARWDRR